MGEIKAALKSKKIVNETVEYWVRRKEELIEHAGFSITNGEIEKAVLELISDGYHPNDLSIELVSCYTQA